MSVMQIYRANVDLGSVYMDRADTKGTTTLCICSLCRVFIFFLLISVFPVHMQGHTDMPGPMGAHQDTLIVDPASLSVNEDIAKGANQHQTAIFFFPGNERVEGEVKRAH